MHTTPRTLLLFSLAALAAVSAQAARQTRLCHDGWSFALDPSRGLSASHAAERLPFKAVELPHDWAIYGPWLVDEGGDKLPWKNAVGWYRRDFTLTAEEAARETYLDFDGVMAHATVYLNGCVVGGGDYGYLGFRCDLTPYLRAGANRLLVKADTRTMRSRWYPGAGIERRVRWVTVDPVHLAHESLYVTTPSVSEARATVHVEGEIVNPAFTNATAEVALVLTAPDGRVAASRRVTAALAPRRGGSFAVDLAVDRPALWELVDPAPLYALAVSVSSGASRDEETVKVGLRSFAFKPDEGFFLNGRRVQLNGVNLHTDMGILGMAFNRSVMRRQLKRMRDMGANALRTSHNAQAPELLELCDEMGLFVWNECFDKWDDTCGRGDQNLEAFVERHLRAWTRRDRNHPSVFVWSIANEIPPQGTNRVERQRQLGTTFARCARFRDAVRAFDATRPVGIGSCASGEAARYGDYDCLDIAGFNYGGQYAGFKRHLPTHPVLYTESASCVSSAGYYAETLPTNKIQFAVKAREVDAMDHNSAPWSDVPDKEFERMERDRYVGGEFVWTGIDYLGEPYPYMHYLNPEIMKLPNRELARSAYFGICDLLAFPKDRFYLYRSHWNTNAFTLHIAPGHWTFPGREGRNRPVYVYTSADTAELFLNGKSLGRRTKDRTLASGDNAKTDTSAYGGTDGYRDPSGYYRILDRYRLRWLDVPYAPGELKAVAYGPKGEVLGEETIRTAGAPAAVRLTPESTVLPADGETYVFVRVNLVDAQGVEVPNRSDFVSFSLSGPGEILAVGNADPRQNTRTFKQVDGHPLFFGQAGLVLRRTAGKAGVITLTATADGMAAARVDFK